VSRIAAELRRRGIAAPMTVANQCARWMRMLRRLDNDKRRQRKTTPCCAKPWR